MNLKLYDFSQLLLEIILLKKNIQKILNFQGVTYLFTGGLKIGVRICRNNFSPRIKNLHV